MRRYQPQTANSEPVQTGVTHHQRNRVIDSDGKPVPGAGDCWWTQGCRSAQPPGGNHRQGGQVLLASSSGQLGELRCPQARDGVSIDG